jgi:hypothetical protein
VGNIEGRTFDRVGLGVLASGEGWCCECRCAASPARLARSRFNSACGLRRGRLQGETSVRNPEALLARSKCPCEWSTR